MKKKLQILFLFLIITSIAVQAQTAGVSFMIASPQGEFKENVDRLGYGFQAQGTLWEPSKLRPFTVGLNIGYLVYGEESYNKRLIDAVFVDVERTNSILNFHLLFQISPFTGTWRPYIETLFGGAYISTETSIESEWGDDDIASSTNFDDFTWSYGGSFGWLIKVGQNMGDVSTLYLDLKARYLFGTEADYLKEGSIYVDERNGDIYYDVYRSKTDLLFYSIGVTAYF